MKNKDLTIKENLKVAFIKLWSKFSYEKISITQLCKETPIARSTFYLYYSNIDELKQEIEDEIVSELEIEMKQNLSENIKVRAKNLLDFFDEYYETCNAFLIVNLNTNFYNKLKNKIANIESIVFKNINNYPDPNMLLDLLSTSMLNLLSYYLKNKNSMDINSLLVLVEKIYNNISTIK